MVATSDRAPMENGARGRMADMLTPLLFGVGCFALWEAAVQLLRVPMYILPPPSAIFVQFAQKFPRIWEYTLVTGQETLVGFAAAILLGVPMGLLVAFSPLLRRTFYPLAVTLGIQPQLSALELLVYPSSIDLIAAGWRSSSAIQLRPSAR